MNHSTRIFAFVILSLSFSFAHAVQQDTATLKVAPAETNTLQASTTKTAESKEVDSKNPVKKEKPFVPCTQKSFVDAIAESDQERLYELMHPALKKEVDAPVFEAWMTALSEHLGSVEVLKVGTETKDKVLSGSRLTSEATITCEKGDATSQIKTLNGRLISFKVESPELKDWFKGPTSTTIYENRGAEFIRRFMAEENEQATAMCHAALRDKIEEPAITQLIERVKRNTGDLKSVTMKNKSMEFKPNSQKLYLNYELECEQNNVTCEVAIQFIGMKGHLVGFNFK